MTFSKTEIYTFDQTSESRKFVTEFTDRLSKQNIKWRLEESTATLILTVYYDMISVNVKEQKNELV